MSKFEVTQLQFREVLGRIPQSVQDDALPAAIRYSTAFLYCERISSVSTLAITLPTEAQWEYACRTGCRSRYDPSKTEVDLDSTAWYEKNSKATSHAVGTKAPNAWGVYDMLGNTWEPCLDALPDYAQISDTDPIGKVHPVIGIMRGGGWGHRPEVCRPATRFCVGDHFGGMGLRLVINCPLQK